MKWIVDIEKQVIVAMIGIYCTGLKHPQPCKSCLLLAEYSVQRLDRCFYGSDKPSCRNCEIHCYKTAMRQQIKAVMLFAGPKMIFAKPCLTLKYKAMQSVAYIRKCFKS